MDRNPDKQKSSANMDKQQPNKEALEKIDSKFPNHAERNREAINEDVSQVKEGLDKKYDRNPNN